MNQFTVLLVLIAVCQAIICPAIADEVNEAEEPATISITPCVALSGADSQVTTREYHRVTNQDDWIKIWQRHKGQEDESKYDLYFDPLGLPLVDFDRYMAIAIFEGNSWNTAGIRAVSITEQSDRILFRFENQFYQTSGGKDGGGRRAIPYGFFVIPRSPKPVVLEENVQRVILSPPVWEERIVFPSL